MWALYCLRHLPVVREEMVVALQGAVPGEDDELGRLLTGLERHGLQLRPSAGRCRTWSRPRGSWSSRPTSGFSLALGAASEVLCAPAEAAGACVCPCSGPVQMAATREATTRNAGMGSEPRRRAPAGGSGSRATAPAVLRVHTGHIRARGSRRGRIRRGRGGGRSARPAGGQRNGPWHPTRCRTGRPGPGCAGQIPSSGSGSRLLARSMR